MKKGIKVKEEDIKMFSICTLNDSECRNHKESTEQLLLELVSKLGKVRIWDQDIKTIFLYTSNKQLEKLIQKSIPFTIV